MIHELKELTEYFKDVAEGRKGFEVRKNDRDFKVGDFLALNEYDGSKYTGRCCIVRVGYILENHNLLADDHVVLGFDPCFIGGHGYVPEDKACLRGVPIYGCDE
ncbi:MAG: DUF3850 domain-containing protein [Clostridia bacterium]|nr:DUF3850 domain-containing protein [Clostridia bacterium]